MLLFDQRYTMRVCHKKLKKSFLRNYMARFFFSLIHASMKRLVQLYAVVVAHCMFDIGVIFKLFSF